MKRKIGFVLAAFAATVVLMALQKPVFMAWYSVVASGAGFGGWLAVLDTGCGWI